MLLKKLKYNITNHVYRFIALCGSFVLLIIIALVLLSGTFNQKNIVISAAKFINNVALRASEEINSIISGHGFIEFTDEGVYFKGNSPSGSEKITTDVDNDKANEIDADSKTEEIINGTDTKESDGNSFIENKKKEIAEEEKESSSNSSESN